MKARVERLLAYLLPNAAAVVWVAAFLGAVVLGPRMLNTDGDLGRHITIGRYILQSGRAPLADLFSHTMTGQALIPHEWLAQVIFALVHAGLGLDGVVLVSALVIACTFWLVFRRALDQSHMLLPALLLVVLGMAASSLHWLTRPHIFTFLLLALWMDALESLRAGKIRRWWVLPLLMLVWANLHGAFLAGLVTWVIYGAGAAWDALLQRKGAAMETGEAQPSARLLPDGFGRAYLLGGAAALAATLANPSGFGVWDVGAGFLGSRYLVGHTMEYLPPNFQDLSAWPFLVLIGLVVFLLGAAPRRLATGPVLLTAAWMVMALYSARNIPLFVVVALPWLVRALAGWLEETASRWKPAERGVEADRTLLALDRSLRGWAWPVLAAAAVALVLGAGAKTDLSPSGNRFDGHVFPVSASAWLQEHPQPGRMFNHFPWGGYLLYRFWPDQQVFIDGQTDFYGEALTRQYEQVITLAPGWEDVLRQYQVGWVIVPTDSLLARALREGSGWKSVYRDETAQIFTR